MENVNATMPHVNAGTVPPLALPRIQRSALVPDLPTMDEAGIKASISTPGRASSRRPARRRKS